MKSEEDQFISLAEEGLKAFGESALPYLVNFIPSLIHLPDWFPGARFKHEAATWRKAIRAMATLPLAYVRKAMVCTLQDETTATEVG